MSRDTETKVRRLIESVVAESDAHIYDVEFASGILRITLDQPGGIDVDTIGELSTSISRLLDDSDPVPGSRYMLEVSSPGIERRLRTAEHFAAQSGAQVKVKLRITVDGRRRLEGTITASDEQSVSVATEDGVVHVLNIGDIETARTVFDWATATKAHDITDTAELDESAHDEKKASAR